MSVHSKMTAIANNIRNLLGISGTMGLDAMATNIDKAVTEVDEQDALIQQIKTALQGKANGSVGGESALPQGYRLADYIQFDGKQTVDTGIICNQNTKIRAYFTREVSTQKYFFGVASSGNKASVTAYLGGSWRFGDKNATKTVSTIDEAVGYGVAVDASQISVSGNLGSISGVNAFEAVGSLLIGACRNASGTVASPQFVGKVAFFTMFNGDEPVRKLIPVTDGTAYRFFDAVSNTFFDSITDTPLGGGNW